MDHIVAFLNPTCICVLTELGVDARKDKAFKSAIVTRYLSSHPIYKDRVTEELVQKWMDGMTRAMFVSNIQ